MKFPEISLLIDATPGSNPSYIKTGVHGDGWEVVMFSFAQTGNESVLNVQAWSY
jgi:hypothetical protein